MIAVFLMQALVMYEKWAIYRKTNDLLEVNERLVKTATRSFQDMAIAMGLIPNQTKRAMDPAIKEIPRKTAQEVESTIVRREASASGSSEIIPEAQ